MKYYIIAGEASGDLHGSKLMQGIFAEDSEADIRFWGGDEMIAIGGTLVKHYKEGAVMGFWEVVKKAKQLLSNLKTCKNDILEWQPDVVILIDYPGFNFKIAEFAHKADFKVFYYIAPKVWASRERRIKKLKTYVDKLFIIFPFEIPYFDSKGVSYIYKGNPLVDEIEDSKALKETREEFLKRNQLEDKPIIAMLAGSRKGEINKMMPVLIDFANQLNSIDDYKDYQFLIGGAPARQMHDYEAHLKKAKENEKDISKIKVLFGETHSIIHNAEAAIVNSGTASLETALIGTPQVVGYIMSWISFEIAKLIVKVKYISLGNLIIDRLAFKELIQRDCNAEALVTEVRALIEDKAYRSKMLEDYQCIKEALGGSGASRAVAKAMIAELQVPTN